MLDKMMLTGEETKHLQKLEAIISKGMAIFVEVGKALAEIKANDLWRASHGTFEMYCRDKFNLSKTYASRIIKGSMIVQQLPIGNQTITESVVRPLIGLPVPKQRKAFKVAVYVANEEDRPVTAKDVKKAVAAIPEMKKETAVVYDEIGRKIPVALMPIWSRRNEAKELLTYLSKIKSAMKIAEEMDDPIYAALHYQTFFTHLEALYYDIKFTVPYAVCGLCQGMKCKVCKTGLMSKLQWEQLVPAETRARFEK